MNNAYASPSYAGQQPRPPSYLSPLESLPPHLLQHILHHLPLPALIFTLKPASRTLYMHAMAAARDWALPLWRAEVERVGGTTDPLGEAEQFSHGTTAHDLPAYSSTDQPTAPRALPPRSRELSILDVFLVSLARSSALLAASSLFSATNDSSAVSATWGSGTEESSIRGDLFGLLQPRARGEDLVIRVGRERGVVELEVTAGEGEGGGGPWEKRSVGFGEIKAEDVRLELKSRQASLLLPAKNANGRVVWKAVVETPRRVQDGLECVARWLVDGLERVPLRRREDGRGARWYEAA